MRGGRGGGGARGQGARGAHPHLPTPPPTHRPGCLRPHRYDPLKKEANLNAPAIKKWLAVGAQPSDTVEGLLKRAMVIEA